MGFDSVAGLVLSGGLGRRQGGADKGWLTHRGRPLIEWALQHQSRFPVRLVSANRHLVRYRAMGVTVVPDRRDGFLGPLSGIESAFLATDASWLYVQAVDVFGMPDDWPERLISAAGGDSPWFGSQDGERLQPLLGLWSRELLPGLSEYLDRGGRRVMEFVAPWRGQALALPPGCRLNNLNSPQALA